MISIVSPVYNSEKIVDELVSRIVKNVSEISEEYEIILVEDGSPDNSWSKILENCARNPRVKGIRLSKNFGQHFAITAGIDNAAGDFLVLMDCDLQDSPEYIKDLYAKAKEGNDIVYTLKEERKHSVFKNFTAAIFFKIFNYLTENQSASSKVGSYSIISRKVINAFKNIKDSNRHYLLVLRTLGFKSTVIPIVHQERFSGKSSYNLSRLIKHAINGITSQSDKLLRLSVSLGFILFSLSLVWVVYLVIAYFIHGSQPGYTSLASLILLSTGLILMSLGIVGIYIGKIFEQVKGRPLYIVDEKINL